MPLQKGVLWYTSRIHAITTTIPERAHSLASVQAAGLAAGAIQSKRTGALARDVATPQKIMPGRTLVGSGLPYARIEHFGGTIRARRSPRMLIRGTRGGTARSDVGGKVTASATEVQHQGKRYLDVAVRSFPGLFTAALRRMM